MAFHHALADVVLPREFPVHCADTRVWHHDNDRVAVGVGLVASNPGPVVDNRHVKAVRLFHELKDRIETPIVEGTDDFPLADPAVLRGLISCRRIVGTRSRDLRLGLIHRGGRLVPGIVGFVRYRLVVGAGAKLRGGGCWAGHLLILRHLGQSPDNRQDY